MGYVLAVLGLPIDKFVLDPAIHWKPLTEFQVRVRKNGTNVHPGPSIQQVGESFFLMVGASESNHYVASIPLFIRKPRAVSGSSRATQQTMEASASSVFLEHLRPRWH